MLALEVSGDSLPRPNAEKALEAVGLSHRLDHYPGELSGGEQQRVAIARAFCVQPDLMLADEPTGNLDSQTGAQIADLLFQLQREQGVSLLMVTHDPGLAARCDRQLWLENGGLVEKTPSMQAAS
jgi:putative ABC transport system ATP-binding protein